MVGSHETFRNMCGVFSGALYPNFEGLLFLTRTEPTAIRTTTKTPARMFPINEKVIVPVFAGVLDGV